MAKLDTDKYMLLSYLSIQNLAVFLSRIRIVQYHTRKWNVFVPSEGVFIRDGNITLLVLKHLFSSRDSCMVDDGRLV